ncbi:MAG: nucleotide exchange factor GrpE [Dehalococcoidia bacterium]|nr:nucleotide exchange factor GrpE [Dehalococcoidia bacterium]MCA9843374.1 nucleotide exchange factor GrpE [Dehalococcoidia bacterium]
MSDEDERIVDRRAAARMKDESEKARQDEPGATSDEPVAEAGSNDESSVEALKERADQMYANWQRSAADFINYKRRVEEERGETARLANAALVINLLPVFDDLERAIATVDANLAGLNWVQGIDAIYRKFGRLLEAMGVTALEAEGAMFDPGEHEAVGRQPGEDGRILHVVQPGYRLGERVIRPAMVIVGNGEKAPGAQ